MKKGRDNSDEITTYEKIYVKSKEKNNAKITRYPRGGVSREGKKRMVRRPKQQK